MLKMLQPQSAFVHHFDEWQSPIWAEMPERNRKLAQRFANDVRAVNPEIKIVIPEFFVSFYLGVKPNLKSYPHRGCKV